MASSARKSPQSLPNRPATPARTSLLSTLAGIFDSRPDLAPEATAGTNAAPPPMPGSAHIDAELWQAIADVKALRGLTAAGAPAAANGGGAGGGAGAGARLTALRLASTVDRQLAQALEDIRAIARAPPPPACGGGCPGAAAAAAADGLDRQLYRAIGVRARPRRPAVFLPEALHSVCLSAGQPV